MRNILLIAISLLFFSCGEEDSSDEECTGLQCDLVGEWIWTSTYGSIAGATWTPESTNTTQSILLDQTNINFYKNDTLVSTTPYIAIETDTIFNDNILRTFIQYDGSTRMYTLENDNLEFMDLCADCYTDNYKKKQ